MLSVSRTGLDAGSFCPRAIEKTVSALCEKFLNQTGRIVGPSATTRNVSRHENEMISSRCSASHVTRMCFWRKTVAALRVKEKATQLILTGSKRRLYPRNKEKETQCDT